MEKLKLIKLTQADPIQIDDKKNLFASKVIQLLLGANIGVLVLIYLTIY